MKMNLNLHMVKLKLCQMLKLKTPVKPRNLQLDSTTLSMLRAVVEAYEANLTPETQISNLAIWTSTLLAYSYLDLKSKVVRVNV